MKSYKKPELNTELIITSPIASLGDWLSENSEYGTEENITTFQVGS